MISESLEPSGYRVQSNEGSFFFSSPENMEFWRDLHGLAVEPLYARPPAQGVDVGKLKAALERIKTRADAAGGNPYGDIAAQALATPSSEGERECALRDLEYAAGAKAGYRIGYRDGSRPEGTAVEGEETLASLVEGRAGPALAALRATPSPVSPAIGVDDLARIIDPGAFGVPGLTATAERHDAFAKAREILSALSPQGVQETVGLEPGDLAWLREVVLEGRVHPTLMHSVAAGPNRRAYEAQNARIDRILSTLQGKAP